MIYFIIAAAIFFVDIITKKAAEGILMTVDTIPVIENIFHFTYVENRGIAFGMLSGGRIIFIIVSIIVLAALFVVIIKTDKSLRTIWLKSGSALVAAGAIGNLTDRLFKGYVVDFLDFRIIDFPVFNVADIAVCVGAVMLVIHFLKAEDKVNE